MESTTTAVVSTVTPSSPMQAALLLAILLTVSCLLLLGPRGRVKGRSSTGGRRLPPSPWGLPVLGNLHQLGRRPHRSLRALAAAHGPVMLLRLGRVPAVVVSSADAAREVLQAQDHVFASRPSLAVPRTLLYGCADMAFAPHGAHWRAVRKLSVQHLLSPPRVRAYRAVREQEVEALVRRVAEHAGAAVCLRDLLSDFARDVAGRIVIGTRASGTDGWRAKLNALVEETDAMLSAFQIGDYVSWLSWVSAVDGTDARTRRVFQSIDEILDEIIDAAEREMASSGDQNTHDSFLHVLLSLMHKEPAADETEWRLSRDTVKALLEDLFGAGTDATIIMLEWAMAELLCHEGAMRELQREARQAAARSSNGRRALMITEQELPGMEYLRAVVKETLRLHSPAPLLLPRESMEDTRISQQQHQYDVSRGTVVLVSAWAISRDPATWESPEEFRPERFAGSAVDFRGRHLELIPFGAGRRMCPASNLAVSVVEIALANLVASFDWALPEGEKELDMEEGPGFAVRKKAPLRAVATTPP
ncbi:hypothetical protein ACP4OV_031558 [Aristida adscensionis]